VAVVVGLQTTQQRHLRKPLVVAVLVAVQQRNPQVKQIVAVVVVVVTAAALRAVRVVQELSLLMQASRPHRLQVRQV
jgi:hypothetical protein